MIRVDNIEVWGFEHAIRGMRSPLQSWSKSDSHKCDEEGASIGCEFLHECENYGGYCIGENDLNLMQRLYKAGTEHRKYARQIMVSMDVTAPLYWWKEFDTYKVGTTANSCSTMHKIHSKEFTLDDFSHEHLDGASIEMLSEHLLKGLNNYRELYNSSKNKTYWWQIIQMLPSSYNQRRTVTMNYENVFSMTKQRTNHKLDEWNEFAEILKELPYVKEIMG